MLRVVATLNIVSSSLSVIGALSIILFSIYKRKVRSPEVLPLIHLSLADVITSCLQMGTSIAALSTDSYQTASKYVAGLTLGFFMTTYLLTMTYAIEAFLRLWLKFRSQMRLTEVILGMENYSVHNKNSVSTPYIFILYGFSWIVPVAGGIVMDTQKHFKTNCTSQYDWWFPMFHIYPEQERQCFEDGHMWKYLHSILILSTLIFVICIDAIIYYGLNSLVTKLATLKGVRQRRKESKIRTKTLLYQVIFCVCWIPTIILAVSCLINDSMSSMSPVYKLQAIFAPLQGFLNSLVYGWYRRGFTRVSMGNDPPLLTSRHGAQNDYQTSIVLK